MATAWDAARPSKTTGGTSFTDNTIPAASDWDGDANTIYAAHNSLAGNYNAHASRHASGGADPITPTSIGASPVLPLRYWFGWFSTV